MARPIDADALKAEFPVIGKFEKDLWHSATIRCAIDNAPTIEAAPVVHGRWVDRYGGKYANPIYDCSECGKSALYKPEIDELGTDHFVQVLSDACPNCGTKMDKER